MVVTEAVIVTWGVRVLDADGGGEDSVCDSDCDFQMVYVAANVMPVRVGESDRDEERVELSVAVVDCDSVSESLRSEGVAECVSAFEFEEVSAAVTELLMADVADTDGDGNDALTGIVAVMERKL